MVIVTSQGFIEWLEAAGVIPNKTRRVIIDAQVGDVVMLYVEMYASNKMLDFTPAEAGMLGARVRIIDKPDFEPENPGIPSTRAR